MISARTIKFQHPKNAKATSQTTKRKPNPLEKIGKMTQ
jgi:hypothetical protein